MTMLFAIAAVLAQLPDAVTNEAVKSFDQGGFKAVAAVLGAAVVALAFVNWRLYLAVREMAAEQLAFAKQSIVANEQSVSAINALTLEVRASRK
jgi:hypothetical protein